MCVAPAIVPTEDQRLQLERYARGRSVAVRVAQRAKMLLLAAEGQQDKAVARQLGAAASTVARWRSRFLAKGIAGIEKDAPRPGRKPAIPAETVLEIIRKTTQETPSNATQWSTRTMAQASGVSEASVRRIWRKHGLKPHRVKSFKLSNDPHFAEKLDDILGLYLNPPENALVLCLDEKSQIQALDRTQPGLPLKKGRCQTLTHDYRRHGTTTLFAALNTLDGTVIGNCMKQHTHKEWLKFLRLIDDQTPAGAPDDAAETALALLAGRYANRPAVLYGLKVEAFDVDWPVLRARFISMVDSIRAFSPGALITLPGTQWARYIYHALTNPVPRTGLIYRTHAYDTWDTISTTYRLSQVAARYPVILGEFGAGTSMNLDDGKLLLDWADQSEVSWVAWLFNDEGAPCLLANKNTFSPTPYGEEVKRRLQAQRES